MRPKKSLLPTFLVSFTLLFSSATMVIATPVNISIGATVTCTTTDASFTASAVSSPITVEVGDTETIQITLMGTPATNCDNTAGTHNVVLSVDPTSTQLIGKDFITFPCTGGGCPLSDPSMDITFSPMSSADVGSYSGAIILTLMAN